MPTSENVQRIAIVGVGGVFPGAANLEAFWKNIAHAVDAGKHAPADRWYLSPEIAFDPDGPKNDRVYSTWECFVEQFQFDAAGLDLDRQLLERLDPLFWIGLHAARAAVRDAGNLARTDRRRVSVILGNIALPTESTSAMCRDILGRTFVEKLVDSIPGVIGNRSHVVDRLMQGDEVSRWHPTNRLAAGLPAALIAQGLSLGGSAFTLDAACASSLYALKFACEELRSFRADAVLAGGMSRPDCQYTQMGFAQLKALSRRGRCSPLSADADGLVVGEGAGVFVLKRLDDALAHNDRIYGVITGIGLSNDRGANLLAPHSEGQLRAMRLAYHEAGWSPSDVDLIECHATGTPVGDGVEIASLHELWESETYQPGQCVVGGVKSNVGHLLTGAGAAGLMKVLFSIQHQTLPPTANHVNAHPAFKPGQSPFRVLSQAEPWNRRSAGRPATCHQLSASKESAIPRRATVNAFGFGGINAHVLIEEFLPPSPSDRVSPSPISVSHSAASSLAKKAGDIDAGLQIAIVGAAWQVGNAEPISVDPSEAVTANQRAFDLDDASWGVEQSDWYQREFGLGGDSPLSYTALNSISLPLGEFRIPPLEMQDMLPQQQLMLRLTADALRDADQSSDRKNARPSDSRESQELLGNRTGVFIGIELDPNTTNFHLRWSIEQNAPHWAELLAPELSADERSAWIAKLKESAGVPLTANRVMGNLGGIVASRLAREFNVGGPSFTISANENSGLRACELAAHALRRGELDRAVVGAVDLPCDIRNRVAWMRSNSSSIPLVDGAAAFVLKRLEDAIRDGDRIHAVIQRINTSSTETVDDVLMPPVNAGAATGALSLANAVLSITNRVKDGQYWLVNRDDALRRLRVKGFGTDGRNLSIELSEPPRELADQTSFVSSEHGSTKELRQGRIGLNAAIFVIDGDSRSDVEAGLSRLKRMIEPAMEQKTLHQIAEAWFRQVSPNPDHAYAMTLVVRGVDELPELIEAGHASLHDPSVISPIDRRIHYSENPSGRQGRLAFVFPGSGNAFVGMGRELLALFPDVLQQQEAENERLREQYRPDLIWNGNSTAALLDDHKAMIFGQVTLATAVCDLFDRFGVRPSASIGYSLGESAALFGLRAWTDRDEMLQRMHDATLFGSDLVRPFRAARQAWSVPDNADVDWVSGAIDRPAVEVRAAIKAITDVKSPKVFLLIINTPTQCVIGGLRNKVDRVVQQLGARFVPFSAPSTVHCEILRQVEPAYRALHLMRTSQPIVSTDRDGGLQSRSQSVATTSHAHPIDFYSAAWGQSYPLSSQSAADAIVAQATATIDFPAVINRAYEDGVRLFVEIGPGSSCTRMIDEILANRPHLAASATPVTSDAVGAFFEVLAKLMAERVPVDLSYLYSTAVDAENIPSTKRSHRVVTRTGGKPFSVPLPPGGIMIRPELFAEAPVELNNLMEMESSIEFPGDMAELKIRSSDSLPLLTQSESVERTLFESFGSSVIDQIRQIIEARIKAHTAYLQVTSEIQRVAAQQLYLLSKLVGELPQANGTVDEEPPATIPISSEPPRSLNRNQCMEFAIGKIGRALGPKFAEIDQHPTRVRLPDEPLMLVDRITEIDGEPLSMTSGRVVTEHDVLPGGWYLDGNRIPTCIAVEAGQADLFLSGWLGIDLETRGLACYRLLDAVVTFHRELPQPGQTIRYDIRINHFFRQGQTYLFRFEFDATVNGQPLLTMREGCAGFFTEAELASGKGVVHTALDKQPRPGKRPADWRELTRMSAEAFDDGQLLALRQGNLAECFGAAFDGLSLRQPMTIPGLAPVEAKAVADTTDNARTRMWLVDRILKLDPAGGKFGMGTILGELDIHPDDWFITCHFCDDQVMPGTLMYECCLHTLRVYLLRMGWIGEVGQVVYEPVPGVRSRLKCRGQVRANTQKVWYEITLKEIGYADDSIGGAAGRGSPYCIADALMYADGKPIVEITDMSVRLNGLTRDAVESLWNNRQTTTAQRAVQVQYDRQPPLFDVDRITAFAIGKPSEAFGDRYRMFDAERTIARLPGPPFQFLDRIVSIRNCEPWELQAGGEIVAQYDVPVDAWYFDSNRQRRMPFAVLLETALQPCGWLAAYVGSALTSPIDLSFRNLGGSAKQFRDVTPESGTLTTTVKMTSVSNSGGMIIQHYDFDLRCQNEPVYVGKTYFGFFSKASLANQIGIRDAKPFSPTDAELHKAVRFAYLDSAPFADSRFQMIDDVAVSLDGGPFGQGFAVGTTSVNPASWFFKAHFYQDPVVPGSLGLESFFQLLKFYAARRWHLGANTQFVMPIVEGTSGEFSSQHEWVYRGQVIPKDRLVTVSAVIKRVDDRRRELSAEGYLSVDGRVIYQMKEFTLGCE